jgi:hypothetical protein
VREKNSDSDLEIAERPNRNERWLSVLLVISLVAYVIVVPGLSSDFGHIRENVFAIDPYGNTGVTGVTPGSTLTDNSLAGQEDYSSEVETGRIYCIIVGTYVNPENARHAAEKYDSQGYRTNIVTATLSGGKKAQLVAVRIFSNYSDAASFLTEFRNRIAPEAWIFAK